MRHKHLFSVWLYVKLADENSDRKIQTTRKRFKNCFEEKEHLKGKKINTCQWMDPSTVFCFGVFFCFCFFQFCVCLFFCDSWGCFHGDDPQPAFLMSPWSLKTIDSRNVRTSVTWSLHCNSVPFTFLKNYKRSLGGLSFFCLFFLCVCACVRCWFHQVSSVPIHSPSLRFIP